MTPAYRLFAWPGWGSALVEAMLALCDVTPEIVDVTGFDRPGPARERLTAVNPLAQVPTLILPDGEVMTESAAIALLLAERHPQSGLAPGVDSPDRARFLRWLVWLVANIYPTFTFGDYPERWVDAETGRLTQAVYRRREDLWRQLEASIGPGEWVLGERFSALDVYVSVMTHWRPRRAWFAETCPSLHAIAVRCDGLAPLSEVLRRNFGG